MRTAGRLAVGLLPLLLLLLFPFRTAGEEAAQKRRQVEQLYNTGYLMGLLGRYDEAVRLFKRSLELEPTAEAYTYLGWTYSHMGEYRRAIEEAEKAIRLDPDFGNPYNDIGVYLMEQGKDDEAVPYLERAMGAKRYCCYQFPHFNMGRIYLRKKLYAKARDEFQKSLAIDPDYAPARQALELLRQYGVDEI